ncbi:MAG: discoidin domain-containing protein [Hamadaea sp.]|nr:discoidin domain-containing protein [Hamadaea sp.]
MLTLAFAALLAGLLAMPLAAPAGAATDLALGRAASADSSQSGHLPSLANDGDPATRWCAADGGTGHWWQVDLGSATALSGTEVRWEFARNYKYHVSVSTDGATWTRVADRTASTATAQVQNDTFTATARYVRITRCSAPAPRRARPRTPRCGPDAPAPHRSPATSTCSRATTT